jgi:hypothetical protein
MELGIFDNKILSKLKKVEDEKFVLPIHKEIIKNILIEEYLKKLPEKQNNKIKNIVTKFNKLNNKNLYQCNHNGCKEKAIDSHEISKKSFLTSLKNKKNNLYIIKPDLNDNSSFNKFNPLSLNKTSIFPGYCKEHDKDLFYELDNFSIIDDIFINKQSLRTLKREIHIHNINIDLTENILNSLNEIFIEFNVDAEISFYKELENKQNEQKNLLDKMNNLYNLINKSIENKNYILKYKMISIKSLGLLFSTFYELSQRDENYIPIFIYRLEYDNKAVLIIAYLDNIESNKMADEFIKNYKSILSSIIYDKKNKLIFSESFINNIDVHIKNILEKNSEFLEIFEEERKILEKLFD